MKRLLLVLACCAATPSLAWDPLSVLNSAVQGQVNQQIQRGVNEAFRSITRPSTGAADLKVFGGVGAQGARPDGNNIVVYSAEWCPQCRNALAYLNQKQVPFVLRDIEREPAARAEFDELLRTRQARGVPMIFVGTETLNGWSVSHFEAMRKRLEARQAAEQASAATADGARTSATHAPATAQPFAAGDVLVARIARVKLLADARPEARVLGQLARHEEVIALGEVQGPYIRVKSADTEGWVEQALLAKP